MNLTNIFQTFPPNVEDYTIFSSAYGTFSKTDCILGQNQTSVNFKKLKLYQASFLTTTMKLDIIHKKKSCKKHKHMEIKQYVPK